MKPKKTLTTAGASKPVKKATPRARPAANSGAPASAEIPKRKDPKKSPIPVPAPSKPKPVAPARGKSAAAVKSAQLLPAPALFDHAKLATLSAHISALDFSNSSRPMGYGKSAPPSPQEALLSACRTLTAWISDYEPRTATTYQRGITNIEKELSQTNHYYLSTDKLDKLKTSFLTLVRKIARECRNVFIVHGRDDATCVEVQNLLTGLRIPCISLAREVNEGRFICPLPPKRSQSEVEFWRVSSPTQTQLTDA